MYFTPLFAWWPEHSQAVPWVMLNVQGLWVLPHCRGPGASRPLSRVQRHFCLSPGCHLYAINTHHSRELRIVVAIRNKLLLITRKHNKPGGVASIPLLSPLLESPVEEFQYIRVGPLFRSLLSWPRSQEADSRSTHGLSPTGVVSQVSTQWRKPPPAALVSPED